MKVLGVISVGVVPWLALGLTAAFGDSVGDVVTKRYFAHLPPYGMALARLLGAIPFLALAALWLTLPPLASAFWLIVAAMLPLETAATGLAQAVALSPGRSTGLGPSRGAACRRKTRPGRPPPAIGPGVGLVMGKVIPGVSGIAIIFPYCPPLPFTQIGAPFLPGNLVIAGFPETQRFLRMRYNGHVQSLSVPAGLDVVGLPHLLNLSHATRSPVLRDMMRSYSPPWNYWAVCTSTFQASIKSKPGISSMVSHCASGICSAMGTRGETAGGGVRGISTSFWITNRNGSIFPKK